MHRLPYAALDLRVIRQATTWWSSKLWVLLQAWQGTGGTNPSSTEPVNTLINGDNAPSRLFRISLRRWNELFPFTSIKFNIDKRMAEFGNSFQQFKIHGTIHHRQGPLVPGGGWDGLYSQIYLYNPSYAAQERSRRAPELDHGIVHSLTLMLQQSNPRIQIYLTAKEQLTYFTGKPPMTGKPPIFPHQIQYQKCTWNK